MQEWFLTQSKVATLTRWGGLSIAYYFRNAAYQKS